MSALRGVRKDLKSIHPEAIPKRFEICYERQLVDDCDAEQFLTVR